MSAMAEWDSFYVIVGSAAGGLIGLQFVVMTLLAARPPLYGPTAGAAFSTPTIVHFSATLFLAALTRVPWHSVDPFRAIGLAAGVGGLAYLATVYRRMRQQADYRPEFEDWLFHLLLPLLAYLTLLVAAATFGHGTEAGPLLFAGAALLLLLIGIHNSWDAVSYHVLVRTPREEGSK